MKLFKRIVQTEPIHACLEVQCISVGPTPKIAASHRTEDRLGRECCYRGSGELSPTSLFHPKHRESSCQVGCSPCSAPHRLWPGLAHSCPTLQKRSLAASTSLPSIIPHFLLFSAAAADISSSTFLATHLIPSENLKSRLLSAQAKSCCFFFL